MGDFSRDPRDRLLDSVGKHYVGVRLQQGVPILDADWNESEDLRRHELASLFKRFFGDGAPEGNDGFLVAGLKGGGVGTVVLEASTVPETGVSSLEIDFDQSTAASLLGFLPGRSSVWRRGAPARLPGDGTEPFALADGLTLAVAVNGEAAEVVTFSAADFADIGQATAAEVVALLGAGLSLVSAEEGTGNDFIIRGGGSTLEDAGRFMVEGVEVINEADLAYTSQPLFENPALAGEWGVDVVPVLEPPSGSDREDLIYLDVWHREVGAAEDDAIVVPAVGVEASVRLRREWAVRVAPGASDLAAIPRLPGHRYGVLARLLRADGEAAVLPGNVVDLRVRDLNVAKYLKTPIHHRRGAELLDHESYAGIMDALRTVLLTRLEDRIFDFAYVDDYNEFLVLSAVRELAQKAAFGAIQARSGAFNDEDGFRFLRTLYDLQSELVRTVEDFGNAGAGAADFIAGYRDRLDGDGGGISGLLPALDAGDFLGAAEAQRVINNWLTEPANILPEGDVVVSMASVEPMTNLAVGVPFNITYRVESRLTSPQAQERIELSIDTAAPSTWDIALSDPVLVLDAFGGVGEVVVTVTPRAGTVTTVFELTATAARNPVVSLTHRSDPFEVGEPPPADEFLQWQSPALDEQGRFVIPQAEMADGRADYQVNLLNTSTLSQRLSLSRDLIEPAGQEGEWHPTAEEDTPTEVDVDPGETETSNNALFGPTSPAVGSEGTLILTATLIEEDGAPVVDGKTRTLEITFVVVP